MRRRLLGALGLVGVVAGCARTSLEALPLSVSVEASKALAAPGDTIIFVATAQGGSLFGLELDYADGTGDQYPTSGARTARVSFHHAYAVRGVYEVRATVTDAVDGQKNASVEIRVY